MTKAAMDIYQVFGWTWFLFLSNQTVFVFNKKNSINFFVYNIALITFVFSVKQNVIMK